MKKTRSGLSPMDCALHYLTARDRSEYEMREYLDGMQYGEADVEQTIDRLKELSLIDDAAYAEKFVRSRLATKPISRSHLWRQLIEHHIDESTVREALDAIPEGSEQSNALAIAEKYYRQLCNLEPEMRRKRVLARLQSRGFGYDCSLQALRAIEAAEEDRE